MGQRAPQKILILSRDVYCQSLLELTVKQFGFQPRVISLVEQLGMLSTTIPIGAWFVDLDGLNQHVEDLVALGRKKAPDARIVFLSSSFTPELARTCLSLKALGLLVKPFQLPRLIQTLHQISVEPELVEIEETCESDKEEASAPINRDNHPFLRTVEFNCPVCSRHFKADRFKVWKFPVTDTDSDFCPMSTENVHPELYSVIVCPGCFYSAYVGRFNETQPAEVVKRRFLDFSAQEERRLASIGLDFKTDRTLLHGTKSFELAALAVTQLGIRNSVKASAEFWLKASWLCRRMGHQKAEREAQQKSRDLFIRVFNPYRRVNNKFPGETTIFTKLEPGMDRISDRGVVVSGFLAGELSRRLGDYELADELFKEVVQIPFFSTFTSLMRHINTAVRKFEEQRKKEAETSGVAQGT